MNILKTETTNGDYKRYCPDCKTLVEPSIKQTDDTTYTGNDASAVVCDDCGTELGHAVWWPVEDR